jgi:serine/threonine protein kinase
MHEESVDWRDELEAFAGEVGRPLASGTIELTGRLLGVGGEAVVAHAIDVLTGQPLAVRFLAPCPSPRRAMDTGRDAAIASGRSRTPWTLPTVDTWIERRADVWHPVVAMPFADGATLHELLARCSPLTTDEVIMIAIGIAQSVHDLHRGVGGGERLVHGDLGPHNLVVLGDAGQQRIERPPRVMLLDVGGATPIGEAAGPHGRLNRLTVTREQIRGEPLDERTDVAALGRLLTIMLSSAIVPGDRIEPGHFGGPALRAMLRTRRGLGRLAALELDRVIDAANALEPAGRQPDPARLAADLEAWRAGRPTSRTPRSGWVRLGLAVGRAHGGWAPRRRAEPLRTGSAPDGRAGRPLGP